MVGDVVKVKVILINEEGVVSPERFYFGRVG